MSQPYANIAVPSELVFDIPSSLPSCRKIEQRIQPYSQSIYNSAGQVVKFTIPQTDRTFASGQTMYITGKLMLDNLEDAKKYAVLGSYYSMFSRQSVNANGTVLETIERPGELVNLLINMTMNSAEKIAQSNSLGCGSFSDSDSTSNITLPVGEFLMSTGTAVNTKKVFVNFALPVVGVLDTIKHIPMWNSNIELELTINTLRNWLVGITTTSAVTNEAFAISELELVFDSIEMPPESYAMIMANYPQKVVLKSQSYLFGSSTIPKSVGTQDVPINARLSSMKQLFFYFSRDDLADQTFGGINPNAQDIVFITNGSYFPQRPIKCTNAAECYMQIQKAFGSIKSYSHSGCIGKTEFCRRDKTDGVIYQPPFTDRTKLADLGAGGNKFYLAIDTEIINTNKHSLYNGIATGVNSNIRVNIGTELTNPLTCLYWCCYDVLLEMDFTTGITRSIY